MGCELLRRSRRLLGDVDSAVAATRALGNEHLGRIAQTWRPLEQAAQGTIEDLRVAFEQVNAQFPLPDGVTVRPVRSGAVASLLVSAIPNARPAVVSVHGGGFVAASAYGYRAHAGALAATSGSAVLVPDYRLASEHPFPAAIDDVQAACEWLAGQGTPVSELVLAADSAGAEHRPIAAAALARRRRRTAAQRRAHVPPARPARSAADARPRRHRRRPPEGCPRPGPSRR
jgi:acetyl esterase/lipase